MAYNTKEIVKDKDGNPISQYFNPTTNQYEPVEGSGGGNKVVLYNEDGTENNSLSLIPILDKLDQLTGTVIDEETRKANELVRISNEDTRIINEDVRIGNEIDRGVTFTTQMNRVAQIEEQVPENIVTGMANLDLDIKDLSGIGRTTQTVKGNADDLVAHKAEMATKLERITFNCTALVGYKIVQSNCFTINNVAYINLRVQKTDETAFDTVSRTVVQTPYSITGSYTHLLANGLDAGGNQRIITNPITIAGWDRNIAVRAIDTGIVNVYITGSFPIGGI